MNVSSGSHRPESEFPSRKYPISLLLHRIESVIRDVAWRRFNSLGRCTVMYHSSMLVPPPRLLLCAARPAFGSGAALRAVCTASWAKRVVNQTRNSGAAVLLPRIVGNSRPRDPDSLNGRCLGNISGERI